MFTAQAAIGTFLNGTVASKTTGAAARIPYEASVNWLDVLPHSIRVVGSSLGTIALVALVLLGARALLRREARGKQGTGFRQESILFVLSLIGLIAVILTLPLSLETRTELLRFFGLLLSAAVALSSTTFLGNMMAGLMLRAVHGFRVGDFVRCGEHFGRVTDRGLLHTELQSEQSDLTTLPNLLLVSTAYTVVRAGGTIVTATVSLGYDLSRRRIEELLLQAARDSALDQPFFQVVDLGDFAVVYRVGGLLKEVRKLLSTRSTLRSNMLDRLHAAGIEIASPTLMSTRAFAKTDSFTPARGPAPKPAKEAGAGIEDVAFEKADQVATIEELEVQCAQTDTLLEEAKEKARKAKGEDERALAAQVKALELRAQRQSLLLERRRKELAEREAKGD